MNIKEQPLRVKLKVACRHNICLEEIELKRGHKKSAVDYAALFRFLSGNYSDELFIFSARIVFDRAVDKGKQRVVFADPDIGSGMDARSALPHENASRRHDLAAETLDAQSFGIAVAAVPAASYTFFMRHAWFSRLE